MTCGLVHASYSLPEWQAVKLTSFALGVLTSLLDLFRRALSEREQSPIPKKIWLPIQLNNFGNHATVRPSICTTGKSMRNVKLSS